MVSFSNVYYSPGTNGFYLQEIHGEEIPTDAVKITRERWRELLDLQTTGRTIRATADGTPEAVPHEMTPAQKALALRRMRNRALRDSDDLIARHRDEVAAANETELYQPNATTLTGDQYRALQQWRVALRHITADPAFPDIELPACPVSLS